MKNSLAITLTIVLIVAVVIAANNMGYNVTIERWGNAWLLICGSIGATVGVYGLLSAKEERARVFALASFVISVGLVTSNHWLTLGGCVIASALGVRAGIGLPSERKEPNQAPEPTAPSGRGSS